MGAEDDLSRANATSHDSNSDSSVVSDDSFSQKIWSLLVMRGELEMSGVCRAQYKYEFIDYGYK